MMLLVAPALTSIKSAGDLSSAAYEIAGVLDNARSYAMANNTYVFVGFEEVQAGQGSSAPSQTPGTGTLAIAAVASRDGTRDYDVMNQNLPASAWGTGVSNVNVTTGANLIAINSLQRFENLHMSASALPATGGMARTIPTGANGTGSILGSVGSGGNTCVTPFAWPLGKAMGSGQYSFQTVINFNPQGVARIQFNNNQDAIVQCIEIDLQQTHGTVVSSGSNAAVIQVDCMTGSTHIYRP
jgi:Tfp pilus assembly protein FimT